MPWGAVVGAVIGGIASNNAANKSADAQKNAANATIAEQQRQYDLTRSDLMPYMDFGAQAIPYLQRLNSGDYSGFLKSPDYLAALNMGQAQIDNSAAAHGGLFGGGHTKDTIQFGSDLASQYLNNYRNSLFQQAGMGQNAAAGLGGLGQSSANAIGQAYTNAGNARASAYQQQGDNWAGLAQGLGNTYTYGKTHDWKWSD